MFCRYVPPPFAGATVSMVSADRAFGHLHPQSPWRNLLPNPGRMHVFPGTHVELFSKHLHDVLRLVRFTLESPIET